jgi:hypothetical protein
MAAIRSGNRIRIAAIPQVKPKDSARNGIRVFVFIVLSSFFDVVELFIIVSS